MKRKISIGIVILIFIVSLIPLYLVGLYDHPSVDDYYYAVETHAVWENTHSVGAVLSESYAQMCNTYIEWQGNFAAIFLMRIVPTVFSQDAYVVVPVILITSFVAAMLFFLMSACRICLKASWTQSIFLSVVVTFVAMQFTYKPSDSFYWYNGSIYYTFFFSLMLTLLALLLQLTHAKSPVVMWLCVVPALAIAFLLGGGNFATSLFTLLLVITLLVTHLIRHRKDEDRGVYLLRAALVGCTLLVLAASFAIAVLAPGNANRQDSVGGSTGVVKALAYSFAYGAYNIASATTFPVAVFWLALCPLLYTLARKTSYSFKLPLLVLLFTFGLFCAQGTPVFYAQGLRMPHRMMNIIYFAYYPFMGFNLFYLMGYLARRFPQTEWMGRVYEPGRRKVWVLALTVVLFVAGCVGRVQVTETENKSGIAVFSNLPLSASATWSLVRGDAAQYDAEFRAREELLSNTSASEVTVPAFSVTPDPIFHIDITPDPEDWHNSHLEMYYGIDSIALQKE